MGRNELCFCGSGKKQKKCHINVDQDSYIGNLYKKYFKIDNVLSDYKVTHKEFEGHPCKKGCFNCCYDVFPVSVLEFELLLEEMRNIGLEFAEMVFEKALKHLELFRESNPDLYRRLEEDASFKGKREIDIQDIEQYEQTKRFPFPCPMLDENTGSCTIYNKRPMICRTFGTTHDSFSLMLSDKATICEHIPSIHANAFETPEIESSDSEVNKMLETTHQGKRILPRQYPIVYWFKIYHNKNMKKGRPVYSSLVPSFFYKKPGEITIAELMP
ncbi:YkgJ family cysteine cluster protein [Bacillus sp. WLY-B-L8]|uniref:YkgJ family cysteine cluster protein n=1 Tax=Bacillus multifaciens TaxID=3068506 RepID=UPI002741AB6A|nr:SEC-C motif-containing protein [Bacillus sp. WLY-B-L8]MDP7981335.1 SEC-C motif-containing protein [Bacillus sp. WLY-B-L8]